MTTQEFLMLCFFVPGIVYWIYVVAKGAKENNPIGWFFVAIMGLWVIKWVTL